MTPALAKDVDPNGEFLRATRETQGLPIDAVPRSYIRILETVPDMLDRFRADSDARLAYEYRRNAQLELRWKLPGWRWKHRRYLLAAIRAWQRYARVVRACQ